MYLNYRIAFPQSLTLKYAFANSNSNSKYYRSWIYFVTFECWMKRGISSSTYSKSLFFSAYLTATLFKYLSARSNFLARSTVSNAFVGSP